MTQKKASCLFFFLFLSGFCLGQNTVTDSSATVVAYWKKGDKASFLMKQKRESYESNELKSADSGSNIVTISVIDAAKDSYTLNWKNDEGTVKTGKNVSKVKQLTAGLNFKYQTSEMGDFKELLNWKEVQKVVYAAIQKVPAPGKNQKSDNVLAEIKGIFSSRESIEEVIMKNVQVYHSLYGGEYQLKKVITAETQLPNFLGGDPFDATITVEMTELNKPGNYCIIQLSQQIDKEKTTKALDKWAEKMGKPKDIKMPEIDISDQVVYKVSLDTGWIIEVRSERTAKVNDVVTTDTYIMKKIN